MKRLTPPAGHIGCIVILICAASMLSRAQSPYLPIPNGEWDKIITLDTAFIRISYEMTFRDALPYSTSEPDALKGHVFRHAHGGNRDEMQKRLFVYSGNSGTGKQKID